MKKIRFFSVFLIFVLFLSGCSAKQEYGVKVNNNRSMELSVKALYDNDLIDMMISSDDNVQAHTDEERWKALEGSNDQIDDFSESLINNGFVKSKYEEGEYKGFIYVKKINNIDDLTGNSGSYMLNLDSFGKAKMFTKDGSTYKSIIRFSSNDSSVNYNGLNVSLKFTVTLPNKPISHNAVIVSDDEKTLTWDLLNLKNEKIDFSFNLGLDSKLILGFGLILMAICVVVFAINKNKRKKINLKNEVNDSAKEDVILNNKMADKDEVNSNSDVKEDVTKNSNEDVILKNEAFSDNLNESAPLDNKKVIVDENVSSNNMENKEDNKKTSEKSEVEVMTTDDVSEVSSENKLDIFNTVPEDDVLKDISDDVEVLDVTEEPEVLDISDDVEILDVSEKDKM